MTTQQEHHRQNATGGGRRKKDEDDDDSWMPDDNETEEDPRSKRQRGGGTNRKHHRNTPLPTNRNRQTSKKVSPPASVDSSSDEDSDNEEGNLEQPEVDPVEPLLHQLHERVKAGKIKGNTETIIKQVLSVYPKHNQKMAKGVKGYKDENRRLKGQVSNLTAQLQEEKEDHDATKEEHDTLKQKYKALLTKKSSARSGGKLSKKELKKQQNDAIAGQVQKQTRRVTLRRCKFLDDWKQAEALTEQLLDDVLMLPGTQFKGDELETEKAEIKESRKEFIRLYTPTLVEAINTLRSNICTEMRKRALEWMEGEGVANGKPVNPRPLPTLEAIKKIMLRDLTVDIPDGDPQTDKEVYNLELLELYLNQLLPIVAGAHVYGEKHRRTVCPTTHEVDGVHQIPAGTEAFVYVVFDNCHKRWTELYKWRYEEGGQGSYPTYSSKEPSTFRFKGKYSDNCSGQKEFGGWVAEGIDMFEEVKEEVKINRETNLDKLVEIDTKFVEMLQKRHDEAMAKKHDQASATYQLKLDSQKRKREAKEARKHKKRKRASTLDD